MFSEIQKRLREIQQPRSNFQLSKFVLGQHPTNEMQYVQLLLEASSLETSIQRTKLSISEKKIQRNILSMDNPDLEAIEKQRIDLDIQDLETSLLGAERELDFLKSLYDAVEHHYSRDEIEGAQLDYWKKRLYSNARAMIQGNNSIPYSYIESMEQAGVFEEVAKELADEVRISKEITK